MQVLKSDGEISVREALAEDLAFVHGSWLESFRRAHARGPIPAHMYRTVYRSVIQDIIERPGVRVICAFNPQGTFPDDLYGWMAFEPGVLHYVYVKEPCRRFGVAKTLLKVSGLKDGHKYTFKTEAVKRKLGSWKMTWDPLYFS